MAQSPRLGPQTERTGRRSVDFVPEVNAREGQEEFHTGVCLAHAHKKDITNSFAAWWGRQRLQREAWRS
jgi:NOL1/NOP2/fmu family ribosome biogenesis protein